MIIRQLYGGHSQKKELQFLLLIFTKSNKTQKKCNELVSLYQVKWWELFLLFKGNCNLETKNVRNNPLLEHSSNNQLSP